jgi:hypothetical protein
VLGGSLAGGVSNTNTLLHSWKYFFREEFESGEEGDFLFIAPWNGNVMPHSCVGCLLPGISKSMRLSDLLE